MGWSESHLCRRPQCQSVTGGDSLRGINLLSPGWSFPVPAELPSWARLTMQGVSLVWHGL